MRRSAARFTCDDEVAVVALDALREGRDDAIADLRARGLLRDIDIPVWAVAIPGTRNILEVCAMHLRVV